jgi:hypothetical protein
MLDNATQAQVAAALFATVERGGKITASQERQLLEWITGRTRHEDAGAVIDHADAWDLAHMHASRSNLARCYIELRKAAQDMWDGWRTGKDVYGPVHKLRAICETLRDDKVVEELERADLTDKALAWDKLAEKNAVIKRLRATLLNIQSLAERGFPIDHAKMAERCRAALDG